VLVGAFEALVKEHVPGVACFHMVDESLIKNTIRSGHLEKNTVRRLCAMVGSAIEAGAGTVLVTCSSIGPAVGVARQLFDTPIVRIDERMAETAVAAGTRVGVIATLPTTMDPTAGVIRDTAARLGREVTITTRLCEGAFSAVVSGDTETHDRMVRAGLLDLSRSVDVVVLAQASMARVLQQIPEEERGCPFLISPPLAMKQVAEIMQPEKP
jgi:Asp/Glu/hydantoin racemase